MKRYLTGLSLAVNVLLPLAAFAARVAVLPSPQTGTLPNSEVVTNIPLNVDFGRIENLSFSIEIDASESNACFIAVGEAQGESLSLEEAAFEWGYDCGTWRWADTSEGTVSNLTAAMSGRVSNEIHINKRNINAAWNMVRITRRGTGNVAPRVTKVQEFKTFAIKVR